MTDEAKVTYTVKEMLDRMERANAERHDDLVTKLDALTERVGVVEVAQTKRSGWTYGRDRLIAGSIALAGVVAAMPAAVYYILGGHG